MLWMGLACFAICIFSSGFLFGAVIGAKGAEKRAVTKIALAEDKANSNRIKRNADVGFYIAENGRLKRQVEAQLQRIGELRVELADRPLPRQRDAKGRFVK